MKRSALIVATASVVAVFACSSEPTRGRADAAANPPSRGGGGDAVHPNDGGSAGAATRWAGTLRGATEVPDGGLPDGGTPWTGQGTVQLDVHGDEVEGRLEAEGMVLEARGNLAEGALRAWLRAPTGQPRTEGVLLGQSDGAERLRGTWRVSGPAGAEVRAGTFEAARR